MNYTLSYNFEPQLQCGIINFNDKQILLDFEDLFSIINFDKKFIYYEPEIKLYPYYLRHNQKISYLDYIFKYDNSNIEYNFKNGNSYDLRRSNIIIYHNYHKTISQKYKILDYNLGHYSEMGKDAYILKNPMWKIEEKDKIYWLMYCEKNTLCKLCDKSINKIKEYENINKCILTFHKHSNGYILTTNNTLLYIHQIITGCFGNGKGTKNISVDHIDQDPLNNVFDNLRVATRKEQEENSKGIKEGTKKERKTNAKHLPDNITQQMLKKYVVYYEDYADKEKKRLRQYFRIEKHPKIKKIWIGCKSNKMTILEKLNEANNKIDELNSL